MHYYQFNIKDYSFATIRMSLMEDLAFRRMLDLHYETESPLPFEIERIARLIGMSDFQSEIRNILTDFWSETESGWVNNRATEEIEKYNLKADTARLNGKLGGRPSKPKKTQLVNLANPEPTQEKAKKSESKANHKPITNNQYNNICQQIADAYNSQLSELGKVITLSDKRKAQIRGCIKEFKNTDYDFEKIETWSSLFSYIQESDFLMGRKENWSANFDFIIKKGNLLKIIEGAYEN